MKTDCLITKPSWRQAVRLKPTGSSCRCCQLSDTRLKANKIGCLRALEGNNLGGGGHHSSCICDDWSPASHVHPFGCSPSVSAVQQRLIQIPRLLSNTQEWLFGPGLHTMALASNNTIDMLLLWLIGRAWDKYRSWCQDALVNATVS